MHSNYKFAAYVKDGPFAIHHSVCSAIVSDLLLLPERKRKILISLHMPKRQVHILSIIQLMPFGEETLTVEFNFCCKLLLLPGMEWNF